MANHSYLPAWLGALALAILPVLHWILLRRGLAVSGRYSALVDRVRHGARPEEPQASQADLVEALRAMTAAEFGDCALDAAPDHAQVAASTPPRAPEVTATHLLFLVGLVLGGALSAAWGASLTATAGLRSALFTEIFGGSPWSTAGVLFVGGVLVGAGTRMAGGCTSGHGLCGVSQLQTGSLIATTSFFGAGVLTAMLLGAFL